METTVWRDGQTYMQRYEKGIPQHDVKHLGPAPDGKRGTRQRWHADPSILTEIEYDTHIIKTRMRELAYLNSKACGPGATCSKSTTWNVFGYGSENCGTLFH
jgi:DNA gyrase subunit B